MALITVRQVAANAIHPLYSRIRVQPAMKVILVVMIREKIWNERRGFGN
jgi:hypothetical protein